MYRQCRGALALAVGQWSQAQCHPTPQIRDSARSCSHRALDYRGRHSTPGPLAPNRCCALPLSRSHKSLRCVQPLHISVTARAGLAVMLWVDRQGVGYPVARALIVCCSGFQRYREPATVGLPSTACAAHERNPNLDSCLEIAARLDVELGPR